MRKLKQILVTITLLVGMLMMGGTNSQAALQSNPTTHNSGKITTGANWITSIRQLETTGQTMGLNETINADLTPATSNNIDVHMMKSTEYGAVAILSASGFGYSGMIQDAPIKSTTGNVTGVYLSDKSNGIRVASIGNTTTIEADARYYDLYTEYQTSAKVGDALGLSTYTANPGCSGWHQGGASWISSGDRSFCRGYGGRIFQFNGKENNMYTNTWQLDDNSYGRGVAVVGSGL